MHINDPVATPWPPFPVSSIRMWDSGAIWKFMHSANGVYDWTRLDLVIGHAAAHGAYVLINLGGTPDWAAADPNDRRAGAITRLCSPPANQQYWINWVTPPGLAYGLIKQWFVGSTSVIRLARQWGANRVRNAGVVAPSSDAVPNHWQRTSTDTGPSGRALMPDME
jgi:hypothetical protein